MIIQNDLADGVTGIFSTITAPPGFVASVNYGFTGTDALGRVGDGNDVAVTLTFASAIPEPATLGLLAVGAIGFVRRGRA